MPGLRIEFLTLVVLAARALAKLQPECSCKCSKDEADVSRDDEEVCDFINKQRTRVTVNEEQIGKNTAIIKKWEPFFRDVRKPISDVINEWVETHINSVLKDAVDDGTPTGNPEDSAEAPNMDSALERTRDYLTRVLKALKDLSSESKETAGRTEELRGGQEEAEKRWGQLLARLDEVEKTNREQREELSARLKQLEDKFTLYKDITEIQKTLRSLSFEIGRGEPNDSAAVPPLEKCSDGQYPEYCEEIVKTKLCTHEYYRRICCASCTKSWQIPRNLPDDSAEREFVP